MYVASTAGGENDEVEEIAIPNFGEEVEYDIPPAPCSRAKREKVWGTCTIFNSTWINDSIAHHTIPTADHPPVRVPPRRVPAHYRTEVERQLTEMLDRNIIKLAAAHGSLQLYMSQRNLETICIDYRELQ